MNTQKTGIISNNTTAERHAQEVFYKYAGRKKKEKNFVFSQVSVHQDPALRVFHRKNKKIQGIFIIVYLNTVEK